VPSFTDSKDMTGAKFKKTGHVTLYGVVFHPNCSIWYILSAYKIWPLSLQWFSSSGEWYDCGHRNWKWVICDPDHAPLGVVCHP